MRLIRVLGLVIIAAGIVTFLKYESPRVEQSYSHGMGMGFSGGEFAFDLSRVFGGAMMLVGGLGVGLTFLRRTRPSQRRGLAKKGSS